MHRSLYLEAVQLALSMKKRRYVFMRELEYPFDGGLLLKQRIALKKKLLAQNPAGLLEKRIAVLGGSTTREVIHMLELFLLNFGIRPVFYESEYNRFYEEGMFRNTALEQFCPDIIYIHTSSRNIIRWPSAGDSRETVLKIKQSVYETFEGLWNHLEETYHCPVIQNNFELPYYRLLGNQDGCYDQGKVNFVTRLNLMFGDYAAEHDNFFIHDIHYEAAKYGLERWSAPFYWHMYKYAMCLSAIPHTAHGIALIIKSIFGKNKKVLALDLDNTLWGGIVGDDGAENIEIGQETSLGQVYGEFQSYLKEQKEIGALLAVSSKNDDREARSGLLRPDSVLQVEDFAAFKANWNSKDKNLSEIADDLSILPESIVFVDDNPAERELVYQSMPEVAVPKMTKVEEYVGILDGAGFFEVTNLSADDRKRSQMYQADIERKNIRATFVDYGEYLKSLEMRAVVRPFEPIYMSRIAQLTNKSNQFNLTTRRYSQAEIEQMAKDERFLTFYGRLEDRFGDNGVVTAVIGQVKERELHIDLWLMSCRVLKRGMEFVMIDNVAAAAKCRGVDVIFGYYVPTTKNGMVKEFYGQLGFVKISEDPDGHTVWKLDIKSGYKNKNDVIKINEILGETRL